MIKATFDLSEKIGSLLGTKIKSVKAETDQREYALTRLKHDSFIFLAQDK